jgi:type VI secretion system secreted protein Hcp
MFLKIDGIRGESVDAKHKHEITIRGFNWAAKQSAGRTGTKMHAKASFSDLVFYKYIDRSSPVLFRLCTTGQKIRRAVFYARKAGGKPVEYLKIILDDVSVQSINLIPDEAAIFVEKIALRVSRFRYAYTPKRSDGTDAPSVEMGWNIAHNCGIFEAAIATSSPPRRPAPAPAMERFAVEVLNAGGKPVSDLSVTFDSAGSREGACTNARGIAHFIGPAGAPTSVSITSPKQLRDILDRQAPAAPVDPPASAVIQALAGPLSPVSLKPGISTKLVITREVRRVRLVGMFFDADKCFLRPSAMVGIRGIKDKYDEHPKSNLLIVGHTDASGKDDHNLKLSLERANAVAAFLTDDVDAWAAHFSDESERVSKTWATTEVQAMLSALPEGETPFLSSDAVDGIDGSQTKAAVRQFQEAKGLAVDGIAGPITRKALITDYMAIEETSLPDGITLTTHGCGENFPVADTGDGERNPEDRRVETFFFDGPITPAPPRKTSKKGSAEYPAWLAQLTETVDLSVGDGELFATAQFVAELQVGPDASDAAAAGSIPIDESALALRRVQPQEVFA